VSRRTTLTIEDDVMSRLSHEARRTGKPLKTVVNDALRRGLERSSGPHEPYRVAAKRMGLRPGLELDDINGLLERIEGPEHR
jgi:hypothetical protein